MYIDYKFSQGASLGDALCISVVFYGGDIDTLDELDPDGGLVPVTRYRRSVTLKTITHTIRGNFTKVQIMRKINKKLKVMAERRGDTVITEQSDV